jgi:hypothetical protein
MLDTKGKVLIIDRALAMRFVIYCKISFTYIKAEVRNTQVSNYLVA